MRRRPGLSALWSAQPKPTAIVPMVVMVLMSCTTGSRTTATRTPPVTKTVSSSRTLSARAGSILWATQAGPEPAAIVPGAGSLWVATDIGVSRIDPENGRLLAAATVGAVGSVAADGNAVWIASYADDAVARIDPGTNRPLWSTEVTAPTALAAGDGEVWAVSPTTGLATALDARTGKVLAEVAFAAKPRHFWALAGAAVGAGAVWVTDAPAHQVIRIDPTSDRVAARVDTGTVKANGLAVRDGAVWAIGGHTLVRIDPSTNEVAASIQLSMLATAISTSSDGPWIAGLTSKGGLIVHVDPATDARANVLTTPGQLLGIAASKGSIWVSGRQVSGYPADDRVFRIDPASDQPGPQTSIDAKAGVLPVTITRGLRYSTDEPCSDQPCNQTLDVFASAHVTGAPVIVLVHGGPCAPGCQGYLTQLASVLALNGAVVFNIDYRTEETDEKQLADLSCAIAFARDRAQRYGGDPSRVTLVGHSLGSIQGGPLALNPTAAAGPCFTSKDGRPDAFVGLSVGSDVDAIGSRPRRDVPVLLFAGTADVDRFQRSMQDLQRFLRSRGVSSRLTRVKAADHYTVYDPGSWVPTIPAILALAKG